MDQLPMERRSSVNQADVLRAYDTDVYSPGSTYSAYSREIQYVFNPNASRDQVTTVCTENDDYAEIEPFDENPWGHGCERSLYEDGRTDGGQTLTRSTARRGHVNLNDSGFVKHHSYENTDVKHRTNSSFGSFKPPGRVEANVKHTVVDLGNVTIGRIPAYVNGNFVGYRQSPHAGNKGGFVRRASHDEQRVDNANVNAFRPLSSLPPRIKDFYSPDPRTTWSPPVANTKMGTGVSLRSYHSNDQLDIMPPPMMLNAKLNQHEEFLTESDRLDDDAALAMDGPPQIAPFSGQLNKVPTSGIVRPIAFKPVARSCFMSPPIGQSSPDRKSHRHSDEGYGSQDYRCHIQSNLSSGSMHGGGCADSSTSFSSDLGVGRHADPAESLNVSRASSHNGTAQGYVQTPSPSDSGVGELEAILREREAEINTLRSVMDKNERAIFQVYEEKKAAWVAEMHEVKVEHDRKLKLQQRKTFKTEQQLMLQLYKLQQEHKASKEALDKMQTERDLAVTQRLELEEEASAAKSEIEESEWERHQKSGEIAHIKLKLKESTEDLSSKSTENVSLRTELRNYQTQLDSVHADLAETKKHLCARDGEYQKLQSEYNQLLHDNNNSRTNIADVSNRSDIRGSKATMTLDKSFSHSSSSSNGNLTPDCDDAEAFRDEIDRLKGEFLKDREIWLDEKNKVIRYQKQLQLNYVQMFRKNKSLEAEVEQLSLELESRDMKLLALNGEESAC